mmetsp:Transcript_5641/g.23146  ORF Transcript_5641/g.23146 Transcript_5641/m.23146 type:complete len:221 (-) Transcript_5641:2875-3537(-)
MPRRRRSARTCSAAGSPSGRPRRRSLLAGRKTASPTTESHASNKTKLPETKTPRASASRSPTTPTTSSTTAGARRSGSSTAARTGRLRGWPGPDTRFGRSASRGRTSPRCWTRAFRWCARPCGPTRSSPSRWRTFRSRRAWTPSTNRAGAWFTGRFSSSTPSFSSRISGTSTKARVEAARRVRGGRRRRGASSLPRRPLKRPETGCSRRWAAPGLRASRG